MKKHIKEIFSVQLTLSSIAIWIILLAMMVGSGMVLSRLDKARTADGPSRKELEEIYNSIRFIDDKSGNGASFSNRGGVLSLRSSFRSDGSIDISDNYYAGKLKSDGWSLVNCDHGFLWATYKYCRRGVSLIISSSRGEYSTIVGVFLQWTKNIKDEAYCVK